MKEIVIFDTEFTAWEGSQERQWSEPWEHRELVQIAAIRIDPETFEDLVEPLDILVKPKINPELSDYLTQLTSITNEDIDARHVSFLDAANTFRKFSSNAHVFSFGSDCEILNENITLYALEKETDLFDGNDIVPWVREQGIEIKPLPDGRPFTSGTFAEAIGAPFKIEPHYALNDVQSIRAAVKYLVEEKGCPNPFRLS